MKFFAAALLMVVSVAGQANAEPFVNGTYYEDSASATGSCTLNCAVTLSAAPAGKAVYNKSLDCYIQTQAQDFGYIYVSTNGRNKFLVPTLVGQAGAQRFYALNYSGPFRFGQFPPIVRYAGSSNSGTIPAFVISMFCSIIGELVPR